MEPTATLPSREVSPWVLSIVPPYEAGGAPPAGAAALLAYLKANGCDDFDFVDLRLEVPRCHAPTYNPLGIFSESFVIDVPDLPLVLDILSGFDAGRPFPLVGERHPLFERYCVERGISAPQLSEYLVSMDRFLEESLARMPELRFVGLSVWTSNYLTSIMAAAHLKRRPRPPFILAGGPQVTESVRSAELALRAGLFDAVAVGEGEQTLLAVRNSLRAGALTAPVEGTLTMPAGATRAVATERKLLRMQSLPTPDFSQMALSLYPKPGSSLRLPYQLSRGCTDECTFCSEWVFWRHFRTDAPGHAVEQVHELTVRYGAKNLSFTDSLLNGHMGRLREFAEGLLRRSIRVGWGGFMRAAMDPETAELLARAGLTWAFIGIESMADQTLDAMNKRRTESDNLAALRVLLRAGIGVKGGIIPGFPGDDRERFLHTARVLAELRAEFPEKFSINVEPFILSPGQPLYRDLGAVGLRALPWAPDYLEVAPRYRDLTDEIFCTVEGSNQGAERTGELRIAHTLLQSDSQRPQVPPLFFPVGTGESILSWEVSTAPVSAEFCLVVARRPSARLVGCLVSSGELPRLEELLASQSREPLFERPEFVRFWTEVESKHLVCSGRPLRAPRSCSGVPLDEVLAIGVPADVIARRDLEEGAIRLTSFVSRASAIVPDDLAPIMSSLAESPRSTVELREELERDGFELEDWDAVLGDLLALGLIAATQVVARPVPPADPPATPRRLPVIGGTP